MRRYRARVNRGIGTFAWFIYRFTTPGMSALFNNRRNVFRLEQAVISMLAGDVYSSFSIRWRLVFFKLIYAVVQGVDPLRERIMQAGPR